MTHFIADVFYLFGIIYLLNECQVLYRLLKNVPSPALDLSLSRERQEIKDNMGKLKTSILGKGDKNTIPYIGVISMAWVWVGLFCDERIYFVALLAIGFLSLVMAFVSFPVKIKALLVSIMDMALAAFIVLHHYGF